MRTPATDVDPRRCSGPQKARAERDRAYAAYCAHDCEQCWNRRRCPTREALISALGIANTALRRTEARGTWLSRP